MSDSLGTSHSGPVTDSAARILEPNAFPATTVRSWRRSIEDALMTFQRELRGPNARSCQTLLVPWPRSDVVAAPPLTTDLGSASRGYAGGWGSASAGRRSGVQLETRALGRETQGPA